jgi:hypothetical protein
MQVVVPAEAGTQEWLDPGFRRGDDTFVIPAKAGIQE